MDDLISRNALLAGTVRTTESEKYCYDCIHNEVCQWQPREYCDFKENAQPVKRGRWEYDCTIAGMKRYHCTNCAAKNDECIADEKQISWWKLCPKCGARMDGDSE